MQLLREFTGWTWEYVDNYMTLPRFNAIARDWSRCPPLYLAVAIGNGFKVGEPTSKDEKQSSNEDKIGELFSIFPVVGG